MRRGNGTKTEISSRNIKRLNKRKVKESKNITGLKTRNEKKNET